MPSRSIEPVSCPRNREPSPIGPPLAVVLALAGVLAFAACWFVVDVTTAGEPGPTGSEAEPMPDLLWSTDTPEQGYPLFVSVERALTKAGELNGDLLSEGTKIDLERDLREYDFSHCHPGTFVVSHSGPEAFWPDFRAVIAESDYLVLARVTGVQKGVWVANPGTLFRLQVEAWLKGKEDWEEKLFFIASVEMELAGKQVCYRNSRSPELPALGWQILIPFDAGRDGPLLYTDQAKIIVIPPQGPVRLSEALREREPSWRDMEGMRVLEEVRAMVREVENR